MENNSDISMEMQILNAAQKLFMEKGFALTSTVDIAKEAGCNQALVHYYFRSKEKLFRRVFEEKIKLFVKALLAPPPPNTSFTEMIKAKIEAHFKILEENPKLPFLVINELITNPDRIEVMKKNIFEMPNNVFKLLQETLDKEHRIGNIRKIEAKQLILNIVSLNIFTFLSLPIISELFDIEDENKQVEYLNERKNEIIKTIIKGLTYETNK